jgi:hypothetical protein
LIILLLRNAVRNGWVTTVLYAEVTLPKRSSTKRGIAMHAVTALPGLFDPAAHSNVHVDEDGA